jgi:YebC/PmpR family DNA-binding regulatory protein
MDTLTDNRNRTVSEIRFIMSKHGGNLGETGCVGWMFKRRGLISIDRNSVDEDRLMELALEAGADDVTGDADSFQIISPLDSFSAVRDAIEKTGITVANAEVTMVPENTVKVTGHQAEQVLKLLEDLEDHDDIQSVSANFDIDEEVMAQFSAA